MSYHGSKVRTDKDGNIVVRGDGMSEATRRQVISEIEHGMVSSHGSVIDKATNWLDEVSDGLGKMAQRFSFNVLSWILLVIGSLFAFNAGLGMIGETKDATGILRLAFAFFAVAIVFVAKFSGGRWGKAKRLRQPHGLWKGLAVSGVAVSAVFALSLVSSIEQNQSTGKSALIEQVRSVRAELSTVQTNIMRAESDLLFPALPSSTLTMQMEAKLSLAPARADGASSGRSLADWVEYGTDGFCRGSSFYKDTYCPDLLDLQSQIDVRKAYEANVQRQGDLIARKDALTAEISGIRTGGISALQNQVGDAGMSGVLSLLLQALIIFGTVTLIDLACVGTAYIHARYPRGIEDEGGIV
ncbi:MAG: hypothetical protein AAGJ85_02695 [Pseudomonadota bacterium]